MADNIELDPGTGGATVAADDVGGVMYPRSKITLGGDGASEGDVSAANPMPVTQEACTPYNNIDLDETPVEIADSPVTVFAIAAINLAAAVRYLHFYDDLAVNVTVGTTTPTFTIALPAQSNSGGGGLALALPPGVAFTTAMTVAATTTPAGPDAPGDNEVNVTVFYR